MSFGMVTAIGAEQLAVQKQAHMGHCIVERYCCPGREDGCKGISRPKSRDTDEHQNNQQVDRTTKIEVA